MLFVKKLKKKTRNICNLSKMVIKNCSFKNMTGEGMYPSMDRFSHGFYNYSKNYSSNS